MTTLDVVVHVAAARSELEAIILSPWRGDKGDRAGRWIVAEGQWVAANADQSFTEPGPIADYVAAVVAGIDAVAAGDDFSAECRRLLEFDISGLADVIVPALNDRPA